MSTIKSRLTSTGVLTLEVTDDPGAVIVRVDYGGNHNLAVDIRIADLLAALNAVPAERLADAERIAHEADVALTGVYERLSAAEAARDNLAATIERVRELLPDLEANIPYDNGNATANRIGQMLRAALDPKPAFVLPTEAGVKFYAEDSDGDSGVFTTLAGGKEPLYIYDDDQDAVYSGPELASWQNFRLLDGDE